MQRNIEKTNKLFTQTNKELNKSFEGKLLNTSPEEIFDKIYKPAGIGQIRTLKDIQDGKYSKLTEGSKKNYDKKLKGEIKAPEKLRKHMKEEFNKYHHKSI